MVGPESAILNIRLSDRLVYPLADDLMAMGVPIIFASGERRSDVPERYAAIPSFTKPLELVIAAKKLFPPRD